MVRRGTSWYKREGMLVEFKTLFKILKNRISDGYDVPQFFRDLMAMITTVSEEEWGTGKDPSNKNLLDDTYRSYAKRKLPKKFAQSVVYRLCPENMVECINERPLADRELLAEDLLPYDAGITADNVAEKVAEYMVEIIRASAGMVDQHELVQVKRQELAVDLKRQYGDYLLQEEEGFCPGCGKNLYVTAGVRVLPVYEIAIVDKSKSSEIGNLLAMCPTCQATHELDNSKKRIKELKAVKKILAVHKQSVNLLDDLKLEKGITGVITKIKDLKQTDLEKSSLDPKEIKQKLDPAEDVAIYGIVNYYVTTYFLKVKEIMMNLDKRGVIDYEEVQGQMKAIYLKLKKNNKSKVEIFHEISEKIHRVTLQEDIYCQIVVAYFIQSCEVFDVITK